VLSTLQQLQCQEVESQHDRSGMAAEVTFDPISTPFQAHFNPIPSPFQPHFNPISTPFQPHFNPILTMINAVGGGCGGCTPCRRGPRRSNGGVAHPAAGDSSWQGCKATTAGRQASQASLGAENPFKIKITIKIKIKISFAGCPWEEADECSRLRVCYFNAIQRRFNAILTPF
jgi:hypothetical protein